MEVRKAVRAEEFAGRPRETVLASAKDILENELHQEAQNLVDASVRRANINTLQRLIENSGVPLDQSGNVIKSPTQIKAEEEAAARKRDDDKRARIMTEIRDGFAGTDADFERLKDQLYDRYLTEVEDEAARRGRELIRPRL